MKELIENYRLILKSLESQAHLHETDIQKASVGGKKAILISIIRDLESLQSKGKTKSAEEFLRNKSYPSGVSDADWEDFKHREKGVLFVPFVIEAMEEYAQSHANKDGWVKEHVKCATLCAGCNEDCKGREAYFTKPQP